MGCILSKQLESDSVNKQIDDSLKNDGKKHKGTLNILLLGPGESGKSTVFNQMKIIKAAGFTESEKKRMKLVVLSNVLHSIQSLLKGRQKLQIPFELAGNILLEEKILEFKDASAINEIKNIIEVLWEDKGIKKAFSMSNKFQLYDQAEYFLDNIKKFCDPEFFPKEEDIIRCRAKTSAIVEMDFEMNGVNFRLIDVGGQKNERKKWIHCFEGITAVIYVASLSEYDQTLFEDEKTNRMEESLKLFEEICNAKWFKNAHLILFLNKTDLFKEKIKKEDPKDYCFPNYTGGKDEKAALEYIEQQYLNLNQIKSRTVYVKHTCAIDVNNIDFVFKSVKQIILQKNLESVFALESEE